DAPKLSNQLGVPVVPIQANKAIGLDDLKRTIAESAIGNGHCGVRSPAFPEAFEKEATWLHDHVREVPMFLVRRLLLDVGGWTEQRLAQTHDDLSHDVRQARERLQAAGCPVPAVEAKTRYAWIREAVAGCVQRPDKRPVTWTDRFDRVLTHRIWGTLIF